MLAGTQNFLPSLLAHVRAAAPGFPLEPVIIQVLLLCIISGDRHLILRTRDDDITLVSKLTTLALNTIFGHNAHRFKCHPGSANQSPSDFLRFLFFSVSVTPTADNASSCLSHRNRNRLSSNTRNQAGKSPIAPSTSVGTARSRRTSISRSSKPSIATLGRQHLDAEDTDVKRAEGYAQRPCFLLSSAQTDASVPTLTSITRHLRNSSHCSTETLKLPSAVVVSGLELASLPSQKAVLRTLTERSIVVSDEGVFGHDQDGLTLGLPDGFLLVYVCRSDPRERPPIYKCLLDMFSMSSSVEIGPQTRSAIRQFRPNASAPPTTLSSSHTSATSAAFPTPQSLTSLPGPPTPPSQSVPSPTLPTTLLQRLKHLCATRARIRPPLNIYLADLFSATRHYGPLDGMMLTVRARQDAEALARASRVLGTDRTGAELIKERAERSRETESISTYIQSHLSVSNTSSEALVDTMETFEVLESSSVHHSLGSQPEQEIELDVSEADIARIFPRVVSHRIRVRDSPFDEILSSAVCGATDIPGNETLDGEAFEWGRETVKDILVHILAEV